jgi:hypothetical protein
MKKLTIFSALLILLFITCKNVPTNSISKEEIPLTNNNLVEADLFFSWLRIGNFYNLSDSVDMDVNSVLDSLAQNNIGSDSSLIVLYKKLHEKELLFSPYIEVKLEDGTQATWFINQADYDTIKTFKLKELKATKTKVHLSAELEHIYQSAYFCFKIAKIEVQEDFNYKNDDNKFNGLDYK